MTFIRSFFFVIFILLYLNGIGQDQPLFSCGYSNNTSPTKCDIINPTNSLEDFIVEKQVKKILLEVGLPQNFVLKKCTNIDNALAYTAFDGTRYIVIDDKWIGNLNNSDWSKLSILAHEIGHHLAGHTIKKTLSLEESRQNELEADKFSGHILKELGASLYNAQIAINTLIPTEFDDQYSTHPSKSKRLDAIKEGYNKLASISSTYSKEESVEQHLIMAENMIKSNYPDNAILYYKKALKINPNCLEALNNIGKLYNDKFDPTTALIYLSKRIKLKNDYIVRNNIGLSSLLLGRINEAITIFTSIINDNLSENPNAIFDLEAIGFAYFNRGQCYAKANYWKNACDDWYNGAYYGHNAANQNWYKWCNR